MTFRFGVIAGRARSGAEWLTTARRAEELGYDTLLVPDTLKTYAPFAALAAAAAVTSTLRLGTYVLSAANRAPGQVAWEASTLQDLSDGRFELGIGGGRPGAASDAETLGADFGTPAGRVARVAATIEAVRGLDRPPPILVAASRPRMIRLAAELADTVAVGLPPASTEADLGAFIDKLGPARVELHVNVAAVAESPELIPPGLSRMIGGDPRAMAEAGSIAFLTGSAEQIADLLRRRRAEYGVSYIGISVMFLEKFAPVLRLLRD